MFPSFGAISADTGKKAYRVNQEISGSIKIPSMERLIRGDSGKNFIESVRNLGDGLAFVKVELYEITGKNNQGKDILKPLDSVDKENLIITPRKLVIPKDGSRSVRIYIPESVDRNQDRYYRIKYIPVLPTKAEGYDRPEFERTDTGLGLSVAWGQLVYLSKSDPVFNTKIQEEDEVVTITNQGDSFIELNNVELCNESDCRYGGSATVAGGKSISFSKKINDTDISILLIEGNDEKRINIEF